MTKQADPRTMYPDMRLKPISQAIRRHIRSQRAQILAAAIVTGAVGFAPVSLAQEGVLEEIIVSAQKRTENLQDVALSVQVLDAKKLQDLGISSFDDYVNFLPSVSFSSAGPSQAQIYMRGISDGSDGNFSGTTPSVSIYMDDAPVTSIGRNLDVHIYDIARIEAVAGPQGTLYGASSQAGILRIVTNQPNPEGFEAGYDVAGSVVEGGDLGGSVEGFVNIPLSDKAAIRLVGWYVQDGGWIDNVPGTISFPFDPNAAVNINGNQNFVHSGLGPIANTGNANPSHNTVEDDVNTLTNFGLRAALRIDLNDSWTVTPSIMFQNQKSDGLFADEPDNPQAGQGNTVRFFDDQHEDEWFQASATVEGDLGFADLTLTGSYLDREVQYDIDYTSYTQYSAYVELYYTCPSYSYYYVGGGYVSYLTPAQQAACLDPRVQYEQDSDYKRFTFEGRLQSKQDQRLRWIVGVFYEADEHKYFNQWHIPQIDVITGTGNGIPTDRNIRGETDLYFVTNQIRDEQETAVFGELTFDLTEQLSVLGGVRAFWTDSELKGFTGSRFSPFDPVTGNRLGGTPVGGRAQPPGLIGFGLATNTSDQTFKFNVTYRWTDDIMTYFTFSEGFRRGGINRLETPVIPATYTPDILTNYEIGWKTTLADGRVRFNGAAYFMEWEDIQFTRFDPTVSLLGLTTNAGAAEVIGIEGDLEWLATPDWTITAAFSYNEAELSEDFARDSSPGAIPDAPDGTELPFTPDLKFTIGTRYNFNVAGFDSHAQLVFSYTDDSWNDLFVASRVKQDDYGLLNLSVGVNSANWSAEFYVNNLTDENAELFRFTRGADDRITANRPRNFGIKFRQRF